MTDIDRRKLLRGTAAAAGGALLGGPFLGFVARDAAGAAGPTAPNVELVDNIADLRDGEVRLYVPEGFRYRSFHDTESTVTLDDGTVLPGRHDGMGAFKGRDGDVVLIRNHEVNGPVAAFGAGRRAALRHDDRGGTTTVGDQPLRPGAAVLHQHQRHPDELLRRPDAVGQLGHLRGDRQRARRGPGLHQRTQHRADQAARLRLRGAGARRGHRGADHRGRPLHARGGRVRPALRVPLPDRGQLRASRRASTATSRAATRCTPGAWTTAAGCRCSRCASGPTCTSRATSSAAPPTR